jgi:hypothetical protein
MNLSIVILLALQHSPKKLSFWWHKSSERFLIFSFKSLRLFLFLFLGVLFVLCVKIYLFSNYIRKKLSNWLKINVKIKKTVVKRIGFILEKPKKAIEVLDKIRFRRSTVWNLNLYRHFLRNRFFSSFGQKLYARLWHCHKNQLIKKKKL